MGPPPPPKTGGGGHNPFDDDNTPVPSPSVEDQHQYHQEHQYQYQQQQQQQEQEQLPRDRERERPWMRDHRRTPRSVRSKTSYNSIRNPTNPFDNSPASSRGGGGGGVVGRRRPVPVPVPAPPPALTPTSSGGAGGIYTIPTVPSEGSTSLSSLSFGGGEGAAAAATATATASDPQNRRRAAGINQKRSLALPTFSPLPSYAYPQQSGKPKMSMLPKQPYTVYGGGGGTGGTMNHQKRNAIMMNNNNNSNNNNARVRLRNNSTNPFDSSTATSSSTSASSSSFSGERRTPQQPQYYRNNPFDTPTPSQSSRVLPPLSSSPASSAVQKNNNTGVNPFDDGSVSASTSSSSYLPPRPTVRVTVHEDRNRRFDGGGIEVVPISAGTPSSSRKSATTATTSATSPGTPRDPPAARADAAGAGAGTTSSSLSTTTTTTSDYSDASTNNNTNNKSVAVDSLDQILDASRTQASSTADANSNRHTRQEEEEEQQRTTTQSTYATIDHQGQVRRVVSTATPSPRPTRLDSSSSTSPASFIHALRAEVGAGTGRQRALHTPPPINGDRGGQGIESPSHMAQYSTPTGHQYQLHQNIHNNSNNNTTSPIAHHAAESLLQSFDQRRRHQNHDRSAGDGHKNNGISEKPTTTTSGATGEGQNLGSDRFVLDYSEIDDAGETSNNNTRASNNPLGYLDVIDEEKCPEIECFYDEDVDDGEADGEGEGIVDHSNDKVEHIDDSDDNYFDYGQQQSSGNVHPTQPSTTDAYNYALHDLCDEAPTTDDIAWRNALSLLAFNPELAELKEPECQMTPLHIACLAHEPPPIWMTRGLLYTAPSSCLQEDNGGRLPLHLLAATSADVDTMRLLVEEFPPGVAHKDHRGFTPLHLLLKNDQIELTLEHLRLLLGQVAYGSTKAYDRPNQRFLFRRGDHLTCGVDDINTMSQEREDRHEQHFRQYPDDVRRFLTKITQWKRRQANKNAAANVTSKSPFMHSEERFLRCKNAPFTDPASIATPSGRLLPLHMLLRRNCSSQISYNDATSGKMIASNVDLVRVLVVAYPHGLVEQDVSGKTPVMTALLHSDTPPDTEMVELLLGVRTGGFGGLNRERPASIPTDESQQLPLHVAAEEMLAYPALLTVICQSYPEARTVQDSRGRTPLHLALANFRSFAVDAKTLSLLFVDSVAKIRDNEGETPFDLVVKNPKCLRESSKCAMVTNEELIFQRFLDSSIDRPRTRFDGRVLLQNLRMMPPWLRRQACAAQYVQKSLLEEMTSPLNTFRILMSGFVLVILLAMLRRLLHVNDDLAVLVYYLATYHLTMQVMCWWVALTLGELFRLVITNPWRWIDLATGILAMTVANISSNQPDKNETLSYVGATATAFCWLSILGYIVDWWIGAAVFVGSATRLFCVLFWPLCIAVIGIVAASHVFYTLQECDNGGTCSLSDAYTFVYWMILGQPVISDDTVYSSAAMATIVVFTLLVFWWIVSVLGATISEASQLNRHQISLASFWEPKVSLTIMAFGGIDDKTPSQPTFMDRYCDFMSNLWSIMVAALIGKRFDIEQWYSCCLRSRPMSMIAQFLAMLVLPIWLVVGVITFGLLWPPQVRRWLFRIGDIHTPLNGPDQNLEGGLSKAKLSQLQLDITELKTATYDQGSEVQRDLAMIKDVLFRALADDASVTK